MAALSENTLFHTRYQLIRLVGHGGMSSVWEALDTLSGNTVAVKIFSYSGNLDNAVKDCFVNEFKLMFNLTYPYLFRPTHFDIDPVTQSPYLVSKLYRNGSAESVINKTDRAIDEKLVASFLHDAASALNYLHTLPEPIIHQDIKPDNFLIDDDGKYILSDFGISIRKRETQLMISAGTNNVAGDSGYIAPERFNGAFPKPAQDIFSLGVTLFEILTGVLPFQNFGGNLLNSGHEVPSLDLGFGYTSRLNLICQHCMQVSPDARPIAAQLLEWANFYRTNNHWPVIPSIQVDKINAQKKYNDATKVLGQLTSLSLNQIDAIEMQNCLSGLYFIKSLNGHFPELSNHIEQLKNLQNELLKFENLEEEFENKVTKKNILVKELVQFTDRYKDLSNRLSVNFLNTKLNQIQQKIEEVEEIGNIERRAQEQIEKSKQEEKAYLLIQGADTLYQEVQNDVESGIYSFKKIDECMAKYKKSLLLNSNIYVEYKLKNALQLRDVIEEELAERNKRSAIIRNIYIKKGLKIAGIIIVLFFIGYAGYKYLPYSSEIPVKTVGPTTDNPLFDTLETQPPSKTPNPGILESQSVTKKPDVIEEPVSSNKKLTNPPITNNGNSNSEDNIDNNPPISKPVLVNTSAPPIESKQLAVKSAPEIYAPDDNKIIYLPISSVNFSAKAKSEEGIKSYKWVQYSGPTCVINGENSDRIVISNLTEGDYTFYLSIESNNGMVSLKDFTLKVIKNDVKNDVKKEDVKEEKNKRKRRN